jgi:N6-L-threonylcarbamoyladenine synthase
MTTSAPILLAIESSCDDTSVAVLRGFEVLSNIVHSQVLHDPFGGVVPELASRAHMEALAPTVNFALSKAKVPWSDITAIAVTQGPGLLGSLLVGHSFAKSLSISLGVPLINVHHMEAHMLAHFLIEKSVQEAPIPDFPYICLTVSGGHTQLVIVRDWNVFDLLGETQDDAVGEAFDKAAKLLSLGYPGGPMIDRHATKGVARFSFSEPKMPPMQFSYSGLKTSILRSMQDEVKRNPNTLTEDLPDWCASIQQAMIRPLINGLREAIDQSGIQQIAIAGGVSANRLLRAQVTALGQELQLAVYLPPLSYTTDNAAMIGAAGAFAFQHKRFGQVSDAAKAKWNKYE